MKYTVATPAVAAVALVACERPANTAYNNSGQSAAASGTDSGMKLALQ